jgi:hypothetical protein
MSDQFRTPDSDDSGMVYDRESRTRIPRWVKVAGIIVALVALVVVVVLLAGGDDGGGHGPSRHGSGGSGTEATPTSAPEVHQPPEGGHN